MSRSAGAALADTLRVLAREIATDTAVYVAGQARLGLTPDTKSSSSDYVTRADRGAEAMIVERITSRRPDDSVLGEEGTNHVGSSEVQWIIDPIDGTTNFVFGHPGYAVSIAAAVGGEVVAGAVADPGHQQVFDAGLGAGACCNGSRIGVRDTTELGRALIATGFSYAADRRRRQATALVTVLPAVADIRRMGSAAVDLCSVALGRVHAYYEVGLNHWDMAAGALIAAEAGADVRHRIVDEPSSTLDVPLLIVSTPGIADAFERLLERAGVLGER